MKEFKEIRDDQIRIVGGKQTDRASLRVIWGIIVGAVIMSAVIAGAVYWYKHAQPSSRESSNLDTEEYIYCRKIRPYLGSKVDPQTKGYTEIIYKYSKGVLMSIYIPHNAEMSLHIGRLRKDDDERIIYAAQAADVRADNGGIVGAFVLHGEPKSWGLSKRGFCASIEGKVTIGVAENSPLFEEATEKGGYFFRQYPLVKDGIPIDNEPKGKSIRRAICDLYGEIFMVETLSPESFHDFAQALAGLGVQQAVYLVGSNAYGWAVDGNGKCHEFGDENIYSGRNRMPRNTSYIVWRRK